MPPTCFIDGYNVLRSSDWSGSRGDAGEWERAALIARVASAPALRAYTITVVFDGWREGGRIETVGSQQGVRVIYTRLGETADQAITRLVAARAGHSLVISNDRELCRLAGRAGAVTEGVAHLERMSWRPNRPLTETREARRQREANPAYKDDDEVDHPGKRHGNKGKHRRGW